MPNLQRKLIAIDFEVSCVKTANQLDQRGIIIATKNENI